MVSQAAALHRRAQGLCDRGRFDLARRALLRALELLAPVLEQAATPEVGLEARRTQVRVLITLAGVEEEVLGDGTARWDEASRLVAVLTEPELSFAVHSAAALQRLRRGEHEEALTHFAQAESLVGHASRRDACTLYLNRGNLRLQRHELGAARQDFERCIALAGADGPGTDGTGAGHSGDRGSAAGTDDLALVMARHNLGYLEYLRGNLPRALDLMDATGALSTSGTDLAIAVLDKARVLIEAGLTDAADDELRIAEREFRRGRLVTELAETELARAECAVLGDRLGEARRLAGSARTRLQRRGNDRWRRVAELVLLTADHADGRPGARLVPPAERLAAEFAAEGLELPSRTAALIGCACLAAAGEAERARQWFGSLPPISRADPIGLKLQQRAVAAELSLHQGQPTQARSQVRTGLNELSRHQAQFGSLDLQTAGAVHGRRLVRLDLRLAMSSAAPGAMFNAIERGRAVSRRLTAVTPPSDDSAEGLAELRQLTEALRAVGDDPSMREPVLAMRRRSEALFTELRAISWRAVGAGAVVHPTPMSAVAETVTAAGKVLVSYVQVGGEWAAVVLGRGRPRLVRLPGGPGTVELSRRTQADLDVLALSGVPTEMRRAAERSLGRSLATLDERLLRPLRLDDRPLVVVPTGPTATLAWGCLPSLRGRSVEVSPTATSWWAGATAAAPQGQVSVQALAGPGLEDGPAEVVDVVSCWTATDGGAGAADVEGWVGAEASRGRLGTALASADLVHVAAHGAHQRQSPLFSSLALADGALFAYELSDARVAPHVVLSACELGQATTRPGDEALGWTRVLLQLGSRCVVAGVSQVADERAHEVMVDYHRRLAGGTDAATALAAATEHGSPVPFVCFGSSWQGQPVATDRLVSVGSRPGDRRG